MEKEGKGVGARGRLRCCFLLPYLLLPCLILCVAYYPANLFLLFSIPLPLLPYLLIPPPTWSPSFPLPRYGEALVRLRRGLRDRSREGGEGARDSASTTVEDC